MTKKQQEYLNNMEEFTKEYDVFCKRHICESCQIFKYHTSKKISCFKSYMTIFHPEFNFEIPKD